MPLRSEQLADYIADRLEFVTFLACCSALLALLTGMNGQQALAFTALNLPFGLALLLGLAMLAPLPAHWRLPGIVLLLVGGALLTLQLGGDWLNPLAIWSLYALLGLAVVLSSRIWAGLLDRSRGGEALARLNALLGLATVLPALTGAWPVVLASGLLFGGVFLSVVASTTALVRHNLPQALWASGISAFTIVFAAGQIVGPTVVGWIADGPGGLARGLVFSACALWVGALVAWRQRPL